MGRMNQRFQPCSFPKLDEAKPKGEIILGFKLAPK